MRVKYEFNCELWVKNNSQTRRLADARSSS